MSTELQRQLSQIREKTIQSVGPLYLGRASIFYDAKKAASIDVEEIFDAAVIGLRTLEQYDDRFQPFSESILHSSSQSFQRELKTAEENVAIDKEIRSLMELLMLFPSDNSTHVILEYLIRRYRINEFNVNVFIQHMIPVHNSQVFKKILDICKLSKSNWEFLAGMKGSNQAINRQIIVRECSKQSVVLSAICQIAMTALKLSSTHDSKNNSKILLKGAEKILSFFTAIAIETIERKSLKETHIQVLYPFLLQGLRAKGSRDSLHAQWRTSSCMILTQLCRGSSLGAPLIDSLFAGIAEAYVQTTADSEYEEYSCTELILAMLSLTQYQSIILKPSTLLLFSVQSSPNSIEVQDRLSVLQTLLTSIKLVGERFDTSSLLAAIIQSLLNGTIGSEEEDPPILVDNDNTTELLSSCLCWLLSSGLAGDILVKWVIDEVLRRVISTDSESLRGQSVRVLRACSQRYSLLLDSSIAVVKDSMQGKDNIATATMNLNTILTAVFDSGRGVGLLLALRDSSPVIRKQALQGFVQAIPDSILNTEAPSQSSDFVGLTTAVVSYLDDIDAEIVEAAWSKEIIQRVAIVLNDPFIVLTAADNVLRYWRARLKRQPKKSSAVLSAMMSGLTTESFLAQLCIFYDTNRLPNGTLACDWMLILVLEFATESWQEFQSGTGEEKSMDKAKKNLLTSAALLSQAISKLSRTVFPLFQGLKISDVTINLQENLVNCIKKVLLLSTSNALVTEGIVRIYTYLHRQSEWSCDSRAVVTVFGNVFKSLHLANQNEGKTALAGLLPCHTSLILSALTLKTTPSTVISFLVKQLESVIELLPQVLNLTESNQTDITVDKLVQAASTAPPAEDLKSRILLVLLSAKDPSITALIPTCLKNLFPGVHIQTLMQIASAFSERPQISPSSLLISLQHPVHIASEVPSTLNVSSAAQAGSLYVIAALVASMLESNSSFESSTVDTTLGVLCPVIITALSNSSRLIRKAGLAVVKAIVLSSVAASSVSPMLDEGHSSLDIDVVLGRLDALSLAKTLDGSSQAIAADESVASAILGAMVFGPGTFGPWTCRLRSGLLSTACKFGWIAPAVTLPTIRAATEMAVETSWNILKPLLVAPPPAGGGTTSSALALALVTCLETMKHSMASSTKNEVIEWVIRTVSSKTCVTVGASAREETGRSVGHDENTFDAIETALLELIARGWVTRNFNDVQITRLYRALVQSHVQSGGKSREAAIGGLKVSASVLGSIIQDVAETFKSACSGIENVSLVKVDGMDVVTDAEGDDEEDEVSGVSVGLSGAVVQLSAALELLRDPLDAMVSDIASYADKTSGSAMGMAATGLLNLLHVLSQRSLKAIISIDYTKTILLDTVLLCYSYYRKQTSDTETLPLADTKKTGSKRKAAPAKPVSLAGFSSDRVSHDIELVLSCLSSSGSVPVQRSAVKLLRKLASASENVDDALEQLGDFLAKAATGASMSKEKDILIKDLLQTFISAVTSHQTSIGNGWGVNAEEGSASLACQYQQVLQPLFTHCKNLTAQRRLNLVKLALDTLGDDALSALAAVLSAHILAAYEPEDVPDNIDSSDSNSSTPSLIILSRSAQRKAGRESRSSMPEELLNFAVSQICARKPVVALNALVVMIRSALSMLEKAANLIDPSEVSNNHLIAGLGADSSGNPKVLIDTLLLQEYASALTQTSISDGGAEALILIVLELVQKAMESDTLHLRLATVLETDSTEASDVRSAFFELTESLLQLLALSTAVQEIKDTNSILKLRLNKTIIEIKTTAMGKRVWSLGMDLLKGLQRLLDTSTFVVILQELIGNEQHVVRQKALQILSTRLQESMTSKQTDEDVVLYLDLAQHLLVTVAQSLSAVTAVTDGTNDDAISLCQSSLLCLDIVCGKFGLHNSWREFCVTALQDVVTGAKTFSDISQSSGAAGHSQGETELLGSLILCCGTLCQAVTTSALPYLASLMNTLLSVTEFQHQQLLKLASAIGSNVDEKPNKKKKKLIHNHASTSDSGDSNAYIASGRAAILLVRSCLAAAAIIATAVPNFFHPYVVRLIHVGLAIDTVYLSNIWPEAAAIGIDSNRSLSTAIAAIPVRLSIPLLVAGVPAAMALGHHCTCRLAVLMKDMWSSLARDNVVLHLANLSSLVTSLLDYRYQFGGQAEEAEAAETAIISACVEVCLKLTENELRTLLNRLAEWRDAPLSEPSNNWKRYSRSVSFFSLMAALGERLQSIFVPTMGAHWTAVSVVFEQFLEVAATGDSGVQSASGKKSKKSKKRAVREDISMDMTTSELLVRVEKAMLSVTYCCTHDNSNFVDEHRYNLLATLSVDMIGTRTIIGSDDQFSEFYEDFVIPCVVGLAIAVGKDVLWKPMNHKLLLNLRNPLAIVRMAALKTLHKLFLEVGDEYLLLLPECLPFLSEVLEDDSEEVVDLVGEVIRTIEDLSGEKLDSYLR